MPIENMNSVIKLANVTAVHKQGSRLIVQVERKLPLVDLKNQDIVPQYVEGLKTDVVETGKIYHHVNANKYRPVIGGISCADSNIGAATLGAIVRDSTTGVLVGLTCCHAAGTLFDIDYEWPSYGNTALSHIKMLQPSPNDGGVIADSLGAPVRAVPLKIGGVGENIVDSACLTIPHNLSKTDIKDLYIGPFDFIKSKLDYAPGTIVYKYGRTSGLTQGTIVNTYVNLLVDLGGDDVLYTGQIMMDLDGGPGDSGSVVLTKDSGGWKILGLYFAGNDTHSFANHILDVADLLQVEAWNGDVVVDGEYDYILVNGRCYQYKGPTLNPNSHVKQRDYTLCSACKGDSYPNFKTQVIN
jgi:hypothetical protein